ncbi:hypothetical protein F2Q70_00015673 [Brassica cretica]|uniref:Uncharacterized protein n=1 Tax=Brassica cretica TaxID=69181 RepID=A0A8S9I2E5_BRACR|nr:hypothetical protein F2Q70_00015673 [Brassica cretica]
MFPSIDTNGHDLFDPFNLHEATMFPSFTTHILSPSSHHHYPFPSLPSSSDFLDESVLISQFLLQQQADVDSPRKLCKELEQEKKNEEWVDGTTTEKVSPRRTGKKRDRHSKICTAQDSSADEEQPANRRRIEVILSQQSLSSDDENDDTPVLEDLRDVLKRKFESDNSNSSARNDLRTTLNARKSRRISAVDPDPKEPPNGDLRDKINAGACDLRICLNRSKPTDLRRRLEQTKMPSNDTPP